jgi:hypothetical protein
MKSLWHEGLMAEEKKKKSDQQSADSRSSMRAKRRTRPVRARACLCTNSFFPFSSHANRTRLSET